MNCKFHTVSVIFVVGLFLAACALQEGGLPTLAASPSEDTNYRLGPGDKLNVEVQGAENLSGQYNVGDNGTISAPLIGEVKAAGLTRAQLEREVAAKLADGYVLHPKVNVTILEYRPFYVYGEVGKPGQYPYAAGMRVLSAVSVAGGFTPRANTDYVVINRDGRDYRAAGGTPVLPDDIIKIPERYF